MFKRVVALVLALCIIMLAGCSSKPKDGSFGVQLEDLVAAMSEAAENSDNDALEIVPKEEARKTSLDEYFENSVHFEAYWYTTEYVDIVEFMTNEAGNVCRIGIHIYNRCTQRQLSTFVYNMGLIIGMMTGNEKHAQKVIEELNVSDILQVEEEFVRTITVGDKTFIYEYDGIACWRFSVQSSAYAEAVAAETSK